MSRPAPLSSFRVRPRFEQTLAAAPDDVHAGLLRSLSRREPEIVVKSFPGFIGLHIPDDERRYWSPRLFLNIDAVPDGGTRIQGVYGPEIEIWTIFLYGYLGTGLIGTFSGILGFCQLTLGQHPWGLYVCGGMAVLALFLYLFAQLGQKFGAWQTFKLHEAYAAASGEIAPRG